ncbi:glyoxylate/hydroxypyruvate reductase A [Mangrovicoccus sp. HB161399]|uniref:2-hydroxyacid dehydrogenase n=1 Tax=Mangrovicoccus sp. HB161399 TaxID=2720392 RepID=UPI001556BBEC|nr:glyoxylate/hydroxypyruvate reductase A [Mangrovicoccus sp. HB161399]
MALLYLEPDGRMAVWAEIFAGAGEQLLPGPDAVGDPALVTHMACWVPPADLSAYPNLRVVISKVAGVDRMPVLPEGIRLCRMVAPGIEAMVRDYVLMAVLMLHRDMPRYLDQSVRGRWEAAATTRAKDRRIGILGLGRTGRLVAETLRDLGFRVSGWSRSGTGPEGVDCYAADGLGTFLAQSDILVCLLPLTAQTRGMLGAGLFAQLPQGAGLVHAGRGEQLAMDDLRAALGSGQLGSAMLDVTDPEPLPPDHWAWRDPRVIVTPHVGAYTPADEGARHALAVIRADRAGLPLPGEVDRQKGY